MGVIDYRDSRAIYEQIASHYKRLILRGILEENEQMPSVRSLAMELSTNPNTVQKAYSQLEADGFVYSVKGRGSFVSSAASLLEQKKEQLVAQLRDIDKEASELGFDAQTLLEEARRHD